MNKVKMSKALEKRLKKTTKIHNCKVAAKLLEATSDDLFYLGLSKADPNYISYMTKDRLERYGGFYRWHSNRRQHGKPGRIAGKLLNDVTSNDLENFTKNFLTTKPIDNKMFRLLSGEKIKWGYLYSNYLMDDCGSLGCSCMRGEDENEYLDIYVKNPTHVKLAVKLIDEKVAARAIIWYPNSIEDTSKVYFDRIYALSHDDEMDLYSFLLDNNMIQISDKNEMKPEQSYSIRIELPNLEFSQYPYMDTLNYINSNDINNMFDGDCLDSTEGYRNERCCYFCEDHCSELYEEMTSYEDTCSSCSSYSEHYDRYIRNNMAYYCEYTGDYYLDTDMVLLYDGSTCFSGETHTAAEGYYHVGDDSFVEVIGDCIKHHNESSKITEINGDYYLIDSKEYLEKINEDV